MTKEEKRRGAIEALWFLLCFALLAAYLAKNMVYRLDSDMASEMLLSRLLSRQGGLLCSRWYYSTEIRVFYVQLVMTPLFWLFSSWHTVRVVSSVLLAALLVLSYWLLCRQSGLRRRFFLFASLLVLPVSGLWYDLVLSAGAYSPFLFLSFLLMALTLSAASALAARQRRQALLSLLLLSLFSFISGLNGARQLLIFQLPLALSAVLLFLPRRRDFREDSPRALLRCREGALLGTALLALAAGAAGFAVNKYLLAARYAFETYEYLNFTPFAPERLPAILSGFLECFGYVSGSIGARTALTNAAALALAVLSVGAALYSLCHGRELSFPRRLLAVFYLAAALCVAALYLFTDAVFYPRYLLPVTAFAVPVLHGCCAGTERPRRAALSALGLAALIAATGLCGYLTIRQDQRNDIENRPAREGQALAALLTAEGYRSGYATFWNGNVFTELSDGQLEMWHLSDNGGQLNPWLQDMEHWERAPEGKVFLLLTPTEAAQLHVAEPQTLQNALLYASERYLVYGFESDAALQRLLGGYINSFDAGYGELIGASAAGGSVVIPRGGTMFGPYLRLAAGQYRVTFRGEGLDKASYDCACDFGAALLRPTDIEITPGTLAYTITLPTLAQLVETRLYNEISPADIRVDELTILPIGG